MGGLCRAQRLDPTTFQLAGDPRLQRLNRRGELLGSFSGAVGRFWDFRLSPDGTRAAVNPDLDTPEPLTLVRNWVGLLRK